MEQVDAISEFFDSFDDSLEYIQPYREEFGEISDIVVSLEYEG